MTKVQSPLIGNALRQALALDAAGGMPMNAALTIVPVAVVADVRDLIEDSPIPCFGMVVVNPVAAQYARACLMFRSGILPQVTRIFIDKVQIRSATAQSVWVGLPLALNVIPAFTAFGRRKVWSVRAAEVTGRAGGDNSAVAPVASDYQKVVGLLASEMLEISFDPPLILDGADAQFVVHANTLNTDLQVSVEWREEVRA